MDDSNLSTRGRMGHGKEIDHGGHHANECQVALALADNLVPGGKADEGGKAFDRHRQIILDIFGDGLLQ